MRRVQSPCNYVGLGLALAALIGPLLRLGGVTQNEKASLPEEVGPLNQCVALVITGNVHTRTQTRKRNNYIL